MFFLFVIISFIRFEFEMIHSYESIYGVLLLNNRSFYYYCYICMYMLCKRYFFKRHSKKLNKSNLWDTFTFAYIFSLNGIFMKNVACVTVKNELQNYDDLRMEPPAVFSYILRDVIANKFVYNRGSIIGVYQTFCYWNSFCR